MALFNKFHWFGRASSIHDAVNDGSFGHGDCRRSYRSGDARGVGNLDFAIGSNIALDMAGHDYVAGLDGALPQTVRGLSHRATEVAVTFYLAIDQEIAAAGD